MSEYALVINAGSSSLKFCTFLRSSTGAWDMEARGQIEGIGTAPRFSAKNASGAKLADQEVTVRNGKEAIDTLASWLRKNYVGAHVLGIGHRVVHGGARFKGPTRLNGEVLDHLDRKSVV